MSNTTMSNTTLDLSTRDLAHWFNAIRNLRDSERTRMLDATWDGQIDSKCWLVNELNSINEYHRREYDDDTNHNVYIFGGWVGILASMMLQCSTYKINRVRSIDLDPWCENIADTVCKPYEMDGWRFKARTADMSTYDYEWGISPTIVINTSSEHVTQEVYDRWYSRIPDNAIVVVQGNDYYSCDEHIRCSNNIDEFISMNHAGDRRGNILYSGTLATSMYTRFMAIWRK